VDLLQPMMVAALLLGGMGVAILGSVKVPLARHLQIDEGKVGGLVSVFGFALIPVNLTAGFLTDFLGRHAVLLAGSVIYSVSLMVLSRAGRYFAALLGVLLLSAGWSLLINASNVLTKAAFPSESTAYSTNLANVFFGLGAFLTPLLVNLLVRVLSLRLALLLLGLAAVRPGVLSFGAVFPEPITTAAATASDRTSSLILNPYLWLLGFALFFYGPLEASLGAWTTTYLGEKGYKESAAANWLSVFWLAFMTSRLIAAFAMKPGYEATLVLVLAIASVLVLADMVARGRSMAALSILLAGLAFGPIFPTLIALLLDHFAEAVQGRAVGLFFAIGGIGWTMIPILIGAYARRTSVQRGFIVAVGAALGLCGVALALKFSS